MITLIIFCSILELFYLFVTESNCIIFGTLSECERVILSDVLLLLPVPQRVGSHVGVKVW